MCAGYRSERTTSASTFPSSADAIRVDTPVGGSDQCYVGDMRIAGRYARNRMAEQTGNRKFRKSHFGCRRSKGVP